MFPRSKQTDKQRKETEGKIMKIEKPIISRFCSQIFIQPRVSLDFRLSDEAQVAN